MEPERTEALVLCAEGFKWILWQRLCRQIELEGGRPQTNLAGLDRQSPQRAKPSSVADVQMSMGLPNTHEAVNLASLADDLPASLDNRNLAGKVHM